MGFVPFEAYASLGNHVSLGSYMRLVWGRWEKLTIFVSACPCVYFAEASVFPEIVCPDFGVLQTLFDLDSLMGLDD